MVHNEDPETLTKLDRFVSATSKVVGNAPINSGQLVERSLVQISDVDTSPAKVVPVMILLEVCEVGEGATTCFCSGSNSTADLEIGQPIY